MNLMFYDPVFPEIVAAGHEPGSAQNQVSKASTLV